MTTLSVNAGLGFVPPGSTLYVDTSGRYFGRSVKNSFRTIQKAVTASRQGTTIYVAPGAYDETVTIPRTHGGNISIVGAGGRGAAYIEPSTEDAGGLVCNADDVTIIGLGIAGEDTTSAAALTVTGSRFRASGCKLEGGAKQLVIGPGTVAQEAAGTHGHGGDFIIEDCEFAWGTDGIVLTGTDYGAATQGRIKDCFFHNLTGKHITEAVGSGGSAAVTFQNIIIDNCTFERADDGTAPTNYIDLNGDNANTGQVVRCVFPAASNGGKVLLSTAVLVSGCFFTGGISTGQPS